MMGIMAIVFETMYNECLLSKFTLQHAELKCFGMKNLKIFLLLALWISVPLGCSDSDEIDIAACEEIISSLPMNRIQVLASHNSYRMRPPEHIMQFLYMVADTLPDEYHPNTLDYTHTSLEQQFDGYGIRGIEFDIFRDPEGGRFYNRMGNALMGMDPESHETELLQPGLKVLHFPDFDFETHYLTFIEALEALKTWSESHPNHIPISVVIQAKEDSPGDLVPGMGLTRALPFDQNGVEEIESEILQVFGQSLSQIILPDEVRGSYGTLREAVLAKNWPSLDQSRGRLYFVLLAEDSTISHYTDDHPSLQGRLMFVFTDDSSDEAAFLKIDDPKLDYGTIKEKVAAGFMIKTRADADTYEARTGDYSRMMNAFTSGAQIIATDYYRADPRAASDVQWSSYEVHLPGNALARVNMQNDEPVYSQCTIGE
jgi:hypothetical protein